MKAIDFAARLSAALYADSKRRSLFSFSVLLYCMAGADTPEDCAKQIAINVGSIKECMKKLTAEGLLCPARDGQSRYKLTERGKQEVRDLMSAAEGKISMERYAWK